MNLTWHYELIEELWRQHTAIFDDETKSYEEKIVALESINSRLDAAVLARKLHDIANPVVGPSRSRVKDYTREEKIWLTRQTIGPAKDDAKSLDEMRFYRRRSESLPPVQRGVRRWQSSTFRKNRTLLKGQPCGWCAKPWDDTFHIDHIVAVARGGSDELSNLTAACATCNLSKGTNDWGWPPHRRCVNGSVA